MNLLKQRFEKSMDKYDDNAVVQRIMAQKLAAALEGGEFDAVFEIGAGTGLLTRELASKIRFKTYIANDLCEKSREYIPYAFISGDARKIDVKADLIVSNAVFQWLDGWYPKTDGLLAFTTFLPGNLHEFKALTGISLDYKRPEPPGEILHWEEFERKLTFKNPLELLAHLKHTGVNSLAQWSFADVKDFCRRCEKPELTYKPVVILTKVS